MCFGWLCSEGSFDCFVFDYDVVFEFGIFEGDCDVDVGSVVVDDDCVV